MTSTCTVKPTNKHDLQAPSTLSFHGLDLISAPVHISNHKFYHPPSNFSFEEVINKLKSSLAEALEFYPPVAGTARNDENEIPYLALDNEGALFITEKKDIPFTGDNDELISPRPVVVLPIPSPSLAVKVTQFSCGTIAVASSLHHWLSDLAGFYDFMVLWARIARGQQIDIKTIPQGQDWAHTPARFFGPPSSQNPSPPHGYKPITPTSPAEEHVFLPAEAQVWRISSTSLAQLKQDFSPVAPAWISSGDALTTLICSVITRAREKAKVPRVSGRSSEEKGEEIIATAADGRERSLNKSMQGKYFGNFNLLFMTSVSRADLISTEPSASSRVALALRTSITKQLNPEAIADRVQFMGTTKKVAWSGDMILTNWSKFDLQGPDMDFGWGKPFDATGGTGLVPGGFSRMLQNHATGEVSFLLAVEREGAEALRNDDVLNKYASFVKVQQ